MSDATIPLPDDVRQRIDAHLDAIGLGRYAWRRYGDQFLSRVQSW